MSFIERSQEIVRDYLSSVAFIDDRIFTNREISKPSSSSEIVDASTRRKASFKNVSAEVIEREEAGFDTNKLVTAFAMNGMHCALCQYTQDSQLHSFKKLLAKSDVSIVDWELEKGNTDIAKDIIRTLLEKDKETSPALRMIVIYTNSRNINEIIPDHISGLAATAYPDLTIEQKDQSLIVGHTKLTVIDKGKVEEEDLPETIIQEFTELTAGIISNATLKSISLLKGKCHNLLGILNKNIDPGLLAHKSLLPNPADFSTYVQELIKSEVGCLIESEEVSETLSDEMLAKWIEANFNKNEPVISINEIKYVLKHDIAKSILINGIEKDRVLKAILDTQKKNKTIPSKERKEIGKGMKSIIHTEMTSVFNPNGQSNEEINCNISCLNSFKHNTALGLRPKLGFGTIIRDNSKNYWLCMQPKCDCVRINRPTKFFFLQLRVADKNEKFDLVMKSSKEYLKLIVVQKIVKAKQFEFANSLDTDVVLALKNDNEDFYVEDTSQNKYTWCGELKTEYAQRISNNFAAQLSRVGMEEYEWLRRS
jgi:hypothetical protein